jgi:hypothetical protein
MILSVRNGQTGVVLRLKILDSSRADGGGLSGLTTTSPGLVISAIADSEATPTSYRSADGTIETITTPGTYQAPTSGKCRFRELNASVHPGIYEIQLDNARFAVAGAKSLLISISGATNAAECDAVVPLTVFDPYAANGGFDPWAAALPGTYAAGTAGARMGNLDAAVSTRLAASAYAAPPSVAQVAAGVWDEPAAAHAAAGSFGSRLDAAVSSRSTYSGGPVASVTAPVTVGTNQDKSGYSLAAAGLDAIVVEPGINARQAFAPILAALGGVVSGAGTGTITIRGANNAATTRITATTDGAGNRSAVTLSLPA